MIEWRPLLTWTPNERGDTFYAGIGGLKFTLSLVDGDGWYLRIEDIVMKRLSLSPTNVADADADPETAQYFTEKYITAWINGVIKRWAETQENFLGRKPSEGRGPAAQRKLAAVPDKGGDS